MKACDKRKQEALEEGYQIDVHGKHFYVGQTFIDSISYKTVKYVVLIPKNGEGKSAEYAIFEDGRISHVIID